jgi:ketosteroid isomerase-like protein
MSSARHDFETLTAAYSEAVLAKDPGRLAAMYDANVRVFDAWESWSYDDLSAWRPNLDDWLGSLGEETVQVRFDDVSASDHGDMGFLSAIVTYAAQDRAGKTLRSLQDRLTWVLTRKDDAWVIAHQHTSFPVGLSGQKAKMRRD